MLNFRGMCNAYLLNHNFVPQRAQHQRRQMQQLGPAQSRFGTSLPRSLEIVTPMLGQPTAAKPPPYYLCDRCKQAGHWKKDCPTIGDPAYDQKKTAVGIPISRTRVITEAEAANATEGVMRLPDGRLVQCMPNEYVTKLELCSYSIQYKPLLRI